MKRLGLAHVISVVRGLRATGIFLAIVSSTVFAADRPEKLSVEYSIDSAYTAEHRPLIDRRKHDMMPAAEGRPVASVVQRDFKYAYNLTAGTPLEGLPLSWSYHDAQGEQEATGLGWKAVYTLHLDSTQKINVLKPEIDYFCGQKHTYIYVGVNEVPVREVRKDKHIILVSLKNYNGYSYEFLLIKEQGIALPHCIHQPDGTTVQFCYSALNGEQHLQHIKSGVFQLKFTYQLHNQVNFLSDLSLIQTRSNKETICQWKFSYTTGTIGGSNTKFLTAVQTFGIYEKTALKFSYAGLSTEPMSQTTESHNPQAPKSSMWQKVENDIWLLPKGMSFAKKRYRGLRFVKINRDDFIDLVSTSTNRLDAWLAGKGGGQWTHFIPYAPPRPLTNANGSPPAGSQFNTLAVSFGKGDNRNTSGWQCLVTSYYTPVSKTKLKYVSQVYFPRVNNELGDFVIKNGTVWRSPDDSDALQLPVPLQFERAVGSEHSRWPMDAPCLRPFEYAWNQGAQFVNLDGRTYLFFVGKCYHLKGSTKTLLAPHRCQGNCTKRYDTTWGDNEIEVHLSQAVWAADGNWRPREYEGKAKHSFWKRQDITNDTGEPNGRFILPFSDGNPNTEDRLFRRHLEGFRNVRFATLQRKGKTNLVIYGRKNLWGLEADQCPYVKAIYRIPPRGPKKWELVPESSGIYPPEEFFECKGAFFADVNADRLDDLIMPNRNGERKVFLNRGKASGKEGQSVWVDSPAYYLPKECRKLENCRFVDLDGDRDIDIFVKDGSIVYLNKRMNSTRQISPGQMTSFTDENGLQRHIVDLL